MHSEAINLHVVSEMGTRALIRGCRCLPDVGRWHSLGQNCFGMEWLKVLIKHILDLSIEMKRAEREAQWCTFKGHILFCTSSSMHSCSDSSWIHMMTDSLRYILKLLTGRLCVLLQCRHRWTLSKQFTRSGTLWQKQTHTCCSSHISMAQCSSSPRH